MFVLVKPVLYASSDLPGNILSSGDSDMTRSRALVELVAGYLAGVFMFSAVGSVATLFVVDLFTEADSVVSRIPYVVGVILAVSVFLFTRFKFRIRYQLKCVGKEVSIGRPIPQMWIDELSDKETI